MRRAEPVPTGGQEPLRAPLRTPVADTDARAAPGSDTLGAPLRTRGHDCPSPATLLQRGRRWTYQRVPLLRSTAFRMAVGFWVLLMLCTGAAGFFFHERLQQTAMSKIDEAIQDRMSVIRAIHATQGLEGVIGLARVRASDPMQSEFGMLLSTPDGARLYGNLPDAIRTNGWSTRQATDIGFGGHGRYRFFTGMLGDNRLSIGMSLGALDQLRAVAVQCLLWAFAASMLLSLLAAWWVMHHSRRRMLGFETALERLADGNLSARVPVGTAGDDVDLMAMTMNAALDRLKGNVESLRQVSTDIAHDLKTPLNRLHIHLDEAATLAAGLEGEKGDGIVVALEEGLCEARHINDTFEALLRVAQIEAGSRRASFKHFDLAETLDTACEIYAAVIEENGHELAVRFDATRALPMYGDRGLVLQLVVNLIENAIRHAGVGADGPITIGVEAGRGEVQGDARDGGTVWLAITDDGPGIPEHERDKVFQRLYRLERSRTTGGTGLGLSLVKAIAELHCGTIRLGDRTPGLRFEVAFDRDCPLEKARRGPGPIAMGL